MNQTLPSIRLGAVLFVSGFCSLVYQVVWLRSLRLVFGSSTPATAVVLALFMGGLGWGAAYFGRKVESSRNPLAFYARLELGIALSAAASVALVWVVREIYLAIGGSGVLGLAGATVLRLLLSAVVLAVPTALMGGTLPAVAQAMERGRDAGRRVVASLYGINTLGAVSGAVCCTFWFLEAFGASRSLWLACAVNLLLAIFVRAWARKVETEQTVLTGETEQTGAGEATEPGAADVHGADEADEEEDDDGGALVPVRPLLAIAGVVGFLFFLMELVWYRMLGPILGGSSYTFGLILAVALCGIGLGGLLYASGSERRRPEPGLLAVSLGVEALCLAVPFALGDRLAYLANVLRGLEGAGFFALALGWATVASIVVLPASIVSGYQFPLLVALLGRGRRHVGSEVGLAYAWNTWGAVVGSLAGGLLLLPWLGATTLWRGSTVLLVVAALVLALAVRAPRAARSTRVAAISASLVALLLLTALGPTAFWRHRPIGAGRAEPPPSDLNELRSRMNEARGRLLVEADGVESSLAIERVDQLSLVVNGKSDGSSRSDGPTQVLGGLVGGLIHPAPRKALVIGLGTGMTAGWLASIDTIERVDVVELEPAVLELSRLFGDGTRGVLDSPKVRLIVGDGREFVRTSDETYDLIFSEPSNPYRAGVADLFSREFYLGVSDRLAPGGIFLHWLQAYEVSAETLGVVYSTVSGVFSHVESWQTLSTDLLLVATDQAIVHDLDGMRRRAATAPFAEAVASQWLVDGLEGWYTGYVGGPGLTARLAGGRINTDDRPVLEFAFLRTVGRNQLVRIAELRELADEAGAARPQRTGTEVDWARVEELRSVRQAEGSLDRSSVRSNSPGIGQRISARTAYDQGDLHGALRAWRSQDEPPSTPYDRLLFAESLVVVAGSPSGDEPAAPGGDVVDAALDVLAREQPGEAELLRARRAWSQGDAQSAVEHWRRGFDLLRADPWAYEPLVGRSLQHLGKVEDEDVARGLFEILDRPLHAYLLDHARNFVRVELSVRSDVRGMCLEALEAYEPHPVWGREFLLWRWRCLEDHDDPRAAAARRDVERFLAEATPGIDEVFGGPG